MYLFNTKEGSNRPIGAWRDIDIYKTNNKMENLNINKLVYCIKYKWIKQPNQKHRWTKDMIQLNAVYKRHS